MPKPIRTKWFVRDKFSISNRFTGKRHIQDKTMNISLGAEIRPKNIMFGAPSKAMAIVMDIKNIWKLENGICIK